MWLLPGLTGAAYTWEAASGKGREERGAGVHVCRWTECSVQAILKGAPRGTIIHPVWMESSLLLSPFGLWEGKGKEGRDAGVHVCGWTEYSVQAIMKGAPRGQTIHPLWMETLLLFIWLACLCMLACCCLRGILYMYIGPWQTIISLMVQSYQNFPSSSSCEIVGDDVEKWMLAHLLSHYYSWRCRWMVSTLDGVIGPLGPWVASSCLHF